MSNVPEFPSFLTESTTFYCYEGKTYCFEYGINKLPVLHMAREKFDMEYPDIAEVAWNLTGGPRGKTCFTSELRDALIFASREWKRYREDSVMIYQVKTVTMEERHFLMEFDYFQPYTGAGGVDTARIMCDGWHGHVTEDEMNAICPGSADKTRQLIAMGCSARECASYAFADFHNGPGSVVATIDPKCTFE